MNLYEQIEQRLAEYLRGQAELSAVRTFEADLREALVSSDALSKGFAPEELPAINIGAGLEETRSEARTAASKTVTMPVTAVLICRSDRKTEARRQARELVYGLELLIDRLRRGGALGPNTQVVGPVRSTVTWEVDKQLVFGIGEVKFEVQSLQEMSL